MAQEVSNGVGVNVVVFVSQSISTCFSLEWSATRILAKLLLTEVKQIDPNADEIVRQKIFDDGGLAVGGGLRVQEYEAKSLPALTKFVFGPKVSILHFLCSIITFP